MSMLKYIFGWSDFRGVFDSKNQRALFRILGNPKTIATSLEQVPTEVLRNLWMVRFESRAVNMNVMFDLRTEDIVEVAQELMNRYQVKEEMIVQPDTEETQHYYVLERASGNY